MFEVLSYKLARKEKSFEERTPSEQEELIQTTYTKSVLDCKNKIVSLLRKFVRDGFIKKVKEVNQIKEVIKNSFEGYQDLKRNSTFYFVKESLYKFRVEIENLEGKKLSDMYQKFDTSFGNPIDTKKTDTGWAVRNYKITDVNGNNSILSINIWFDSPEDTVLDDQSGKRATAVINVDAFQTFTRRSFVKLVNGSAYIDGDFVKKVLFIALKNEGIVTLPYLTMSINSVPSEEAKQTKEHILKFPDSRVIKIGFVDNRPAIKAKAKEAIGIEIIPDVIPSYKKPPKGVMFDSRGNYPQNFTGTFPNVKGELNPNDYQTYCYRIATPQEIADNDKVIPVEIEGINYYIKRVPPEKSGFENFFNKIIYTDFDKDFIFYYTSDGRRSQISIQKCQKLSDYDALYLASKAPINFKTSIFVKEDHPIVKEPFYESYKNKIFEIAKNAKKYAGKEDIAKVEEYQIPVYVLKMSGYYEEIMSGYRIYLDKYCGANQKLWGTLDSNGYCILDIDNPEKGGFNIPELRKSVEEKEKHNKEVAQDTNGDTPFLPKNIKGFTNKMSLFPQQAIAVSMADEQDNCLLDVDMGGGKTCMMVADICNQMTKGKVKRPLIVCPGKTLAQNRKEIFEKWCDKKMNVFPINTETWNRITDRGLNPQALVDIVDKMPPNTIYMTDYSFVALDAKIIPIGTKQKTKTGPEELVFTEVFSRANFLMNKLKFDMVYLDESHYIKNISSNVAKATAVLGKAKIKRITSGTIIPNSISDLFGQLRFLDPTILGRQEDFIKNYGIIDDNTGKFTGRWQEDSQKRIRALIEQRGGVSIRRSMWRWRMPSLTEKIHYVELTDVQKEIYNMIMENLKIELSEDPKIQAAMEKIKNDNEDVGDTDYESVLAKLSRFTTFLAAPGSDAIIQALKALKEGKSIQEVRQSFVTNTLNDVNDEGTSKEESDFDSSVSISDSDLAKLQEISKTITDKDIIGPKISEVNSILEHHFSAGFDKDGNAKNGKVIIFCQRNDIAKSTYENIDGKFRSHAVWYNASRQKELMKFQQEPNCWIIIAVDKSLKEGINLQQASRIIRLDIHWNPGDNDQSYARAFRSGQKRNVNVDIILCEGTMEICKYMRLISKEYLNRKLISNFNEGNNYDFTPVRMSIENMETFTTKSSVAPFETMHNMIKDDEIKESKKYGEKYSSYQDKNISTIGSDEQLEGSKMVFTPDLSDDLKMEKLVNNDDSRIRLTKVEYIGKTEKEIEDMKNDVEEEKELKRQKYISNLNQQRKEDKIQELSEKLGFNPLEVLEEQTADPKNIHLWLLDRDDDIYLMTLKNSTSNFLTKFRFKSKGIKYIKMIKSVEDLKSLNRILKKNDYESNLEEDIINDKSLNRLLGIKKNPNAIATIKKYYQATAKRSNGYIEFDWTRMEKGLFLTTDVDMSEFGFLKIPKSLERLITPALLAKILSDINAESPIGNLKDLNEESQKRFGKKINIIRIISNSKNRDLSEYEEDKLPKKPTDEDKEDRVPKKHSKDNERKSTKSNKPKTNYKANDFENAQLILGTLDFVSKDKSMAKAFNTIFSDLTGYDLIKLMKKQGASKFSEGSKVLFKTYYDKLNRCSSTKKAIMQLRNELSLTSSDMQEIASYASKYQK